jgi:hypothetical protein
VGTSLTTSLLAGAGILTATGEWAALVIPPALVLGLAFGVVGAFAGRTLHRHPARVGAAGAGLAASLAVAVGLQIPGLLIDLVGDFSLPFTSLSPWGLLVGMFLGGILVGVLVAAVALSEAVLGPRSALGQRFLGALSWPGTALRLAATGAVVLGLLHGVGVLVTAAFGYSGPADGYLQQAPLVAVALTLVAWPALEQGKGAYLKQLPPARRGLPEEAGPG